MQRLLTGLVLVLFIAVAVLAIAVYKMDGNGTGPARQPPAARPAVQLVDPSASRDNEQDKRIMTLMEEIASLKRELQSRPAVPVASPPSDVAGGGGPGEGGPPPLAPSPGVRQRDLNGELVITEEDVELFQKVQEHVLRQQAVDNQTRSVMLRVDRMGGRGDIVPLTGDHRREVEAVLRKYVASGHDLTGRYLRSPDPDIEELDTEQRRERLMQGRTELVAQARRELEPMVGVEDAQKIAEEALQRPWGLGRNGRRFER